MKAVEKDHKGATVRFSIEELDAMRNGLNEARHLLKGRDGADFQTRIGMTVDEAGALIKELQRLVADLSHASDVAKQKQSA
jgi:hypothetical protein